MTDSEKIWDLRVAIGDDVRIAGIDAWHRVVAIEVFADQGGSLGGKGFEVLIRFEDGWSTVYYYVREVRRNGATVPTNGLHLVQSHLGPS